MGKRLCLFNFIATNVSVSVHHLLRGRVWAVVCVTLSFGWTTKFLVECH